jgi:hypothetical protein
MTEKFLEAITDLVDVIKTHDKKIYQCEEHIDNILHRLNMVEDTLGITYQRPTQDMELAREIDFRLDAIKQAIQKEAQ